MKIILHAIVNLVIFGLLYLLTSIITYFPIGIYAMGCGTSCEQYSVIPFITSGIVLLVGYTLLTFLQQKLLRTLFAKFSIWIIPIIGLSWSTPILTGMISLGK